MIKWYLSGQLEIPGDRNGQLQQAMEMSPLIPRTETKDSVITLDYVSTQEDLCQE